MLKRAPRHAAKVKSVTQTGITAKTKGQGKVPDEKIKAPYAEV